MGVHILNFIFNTRVQKFHRLMYVDSAHTSWCMMTLCAHKCKRGGYVCVCKSKWERFMTILMVTLSTRSGKWSDSTVNQYLHWHTKSAGKPSYHAYVKAEEKLYWNSFNHGLSKYVAYSQSLLTLIHCDLRGR